jgi:hypothetical protein
MYCDELVGKSHSDCRNQVSVQNYGSKSLRKQVLEKGVLVKNTLDGGTNTEKVGI